MATLNHIGIAVQDLPAIKKLFQIMGLSIGHEELVQDQGVRTHFLPLPLEPATLELLEPVDPEGTVAKFIAKKGPGIHHLSFSLKRGELGTLSQKLRDAGYRLIYDAPRKGAHKMMINFIHPASAGGILIELMEPLLVSEPSDIT